MTWIARLERPAEVGPGCRVRGVLQNRSFVHDSRGFLIETIDPELGTSPNDYVYYCQHSGLGRPGRQMYRSQTCTNPPSSDVADSYYDAAGRPLETWMTVSGSWYLVSHTAYGAAAGDHALGKPVVETQYTTVTPSPGPPTSECLDPGSIRVSEVYDYRGPQGLASRRSTEVRFNADGSGGWQKFDVGYSYDRWANLSQIQYPTLTGLASWEEAPDPALSTDRRRRRRMRCGTSVGCRTRYRRLPG